MQNQEWYVDIWLTIVWVAYLVVFLGTILKRKEPHIYVANWIFCPSSSPSPCCTSSTIWRSPVSFLGVKSYSAFSGVPGCCDAVVVWP